MKRTIPLAIGIVLLFLLVGNRFSVSPSGISGVFPWVGGDGFRSAPAGGRPSAVLREVTAYNVGDRKQTDRTPCIGATGVDLCRLVDRGLNVCAANFVDLGTTLVIEEFGECRVLDRMNSRYSHRVDIAMRKDEVRKAVEFGLQQRVVEVKQHLDE